MQMSMFDGSQHFKLRKKVRLISLFSGYDSQLQALKNIGVDVESWRTCEWAVKSIQALKDLHFSEDTTDYSKGLSKQDVIDFLFEKHISMDYNQPMTLEQIKRLGETKQRQIYNNIKATHNLVDINQVKAEDLGIEDSDDVSYILTYSFPCQDLSNAGLRKGMEKGSGTRSENVWQVERLLDELIGGGISLPPVLIMENVPEVIGARNVKHFAKWRDKLESIGYHCYWKILNATDYGIPQNRERCFMISILGDFYFDFPQKQKLEKRLDNLLEEEVDDKYFLSDVALIGSVNTNFQCSQIENKLPKNGIIPTICARDYKDPKCVQIDKRGGGFQKITIGSKVYDIKKNTKNYIEWEQPGCFVCKTRAWKTNRIAPTLTTDCGRIMILK